MNAVNFIGGLTVLCLTNLLLFFIISISTKSVSWAKGIRSSNSVNELPGNDKSVWWDMHIHTYINTYILVCNYKTDKNTQLKIRD